MRVGGDAALVCVLLLGLGGGKKKGEYSRLSHLSPLSHHTPTSTIYNPSTAPTRARAFIPTGVGIRRASKTVGADGGRNLLASAQQALVQAHAAEAHAAQQTHRAGRTV